MVSTEEQIRAFCFSTVVFQTMDTYSHLLPLLQEGAASALKKVLF